MTMKKTGQTPYCFSARLQAQLAKIPKFFLTVVEAPSGCGKTTAVREYFASAHKEGVRRKWYTCLGESPAKAWAGICGLFGAADEAIALELKALGVPTLETLPEVIALLRQCRCLEPCYCIIDNYQLFETSVQKKLIMALSACHVKNLRLIVITQPLTDSGETTHPENPCHTITAKDFFFDHTCIARYCHLAGIPISREEILRIQATAEGWIAAIRLQLKHYQESGLLMDARAAGSLVEAAVWNKLSAREKRFMLALSLLDGFTASQAAIMGGGAGMPKSVADMLSLDFFIRRVADKNLYSLHSILRDYLLERFSMLPPDDVRAMHRKAAKACLSVADYFQAAQFFLKLSDYEAILSMPFTDQYFFNNQERDIIQFFARVFQQCPPPVLLKHPLTLVTLGIQFFKRGMRPQYDRVVKLMEEFFKYPSGLSESELYRVKGECEMMLFFSGFNDVAKMGEHHKKAHEYLRRVANPPRSRIYVGNLPWAVGVPSVISVYWNKSGGLEKTLETMDECLPFYTELAGGHGAGGEILMRGEACLARGDDRNAEVLCYRTLLTARDAGQTGNCLCAALILARIGILRGDENAYSEARRNIARDMEQARQPALTRLGEMCLATLDMALGGTDKLPEWLRHVQTIRRTLYSVTQPHAIMLHGLLLLREKRYAELYALTETALKKTDDIQYPLLQTHHLIYLARAKRDEGYVGEAADHLRQALSIALPDRVYLPFAEQGNALLPMLKREKKHFDKEAMRQCIALAQRWSAGAAKVRRALPKTPGRRPGETRQVEKAALDKLHAFAAEKKLTGKETEVLSHIIRNLSVREIAAGMGVSSHAVAYHITNILRKTNVRRRRCLPRICAAWKRTKAGRETALQENHDPKQTRRSLSGELAALTPRQREIALLIHEGLTAKEIAAKLFLSENTVAWMRKTIYRKLKIRSKMALAKMKL